MKTTDYIVVGSGIAGVCIAHALQEKGADVYLISDHRPSAATQVAAGLINPVTGRYFVKSWMIDDLLPVARSTYKALEDKLEEVFWNDLPILRTLSSPKEQNDWLGRSSQPGYTPYMQDAQDIGVLSSVIGNNNVYGETLGGAQVEIGRLSNAFVRFMSDRNRFLQSEFSYDTLQVTTDSVQYDGIQAKGIVFAEGYRGKENPFFPDLPYHGDKGEVFHLTTPQEELAEKAVKKDVFLVPRPALGCYWVGASYERTYTNEEPTPQGAAQLHEKLMDWLSTPYEVERHLAAVRPTTRDRKPFLGRHPIHANVFIFNGLGTKGTSLAPFWAEHLSEVILAGIAIDNQVDIDRCKKKSVK